jgi:protein associated with RNAse G/E
MEPKEQSEFILNRIKFILSLCLKGAITEENLNYTAIQLALMEVQDIKKAIDWHDFETPNKEYEYWDEVKNELNKSN